MTEEQKKRKLEKNREYKARKRAEKKAAALALQIPQEQIEKAPESAMQDCATVGIQSGDSGFNLEDPLHQLDRAISHEDFVRMSRRHT